MADEVVHYPLRTMTEEDVPVPPDVYAEDDEMHRVRLELA